MNRAEILRAAEKCVNGDRQQDYGTPESNFACVANLWNACLGLEAKIDAKDVACMLALLKIARTSTGNGKTDNWIDLAGYAACGGEIENGQKKTVGDTP